MDVLFKSGLVMGFYGLAVILAFIVVICAVWKELHKPVDKEAKKARMAYLEAKRERWERYFLER